MTSGTPSIPGPSPQQAEIAYADSHCHLNYEGLAGQTDEVLRRMAQAGVRRALNVCTTLEEAKGKKTNK